MNRLFINRKNDDADPGEKASIRELFLNFVTEHKFATFMIVFLVIAAVIITVQATKKTDYELYLMYCGPEYAASADIYGYVVDSAANACKEGEVLPEIAFSTIVYVNDDLAAYYQQEGIEYNGAYNNEALQNFDYALAAGEYCVLLLDRKLYDDTKHLDVFVPLSELGIESEAAYDEFALMLSSLPVGKTAGFASLPDDTVIVLRKKSFIQSLFANKNKTEERYQAQRECFIKLANFE